MTISRKHVLGFVEAVATTLHQNREHLTELDAAIGDADHGINMDRGFKAVMARLPTVEQKDIGTILKVVGMASVSTVGGAAGPLCGTFFLRMGAAAAHESPARLIPRAERKQLPLAFCQDMGYSSSLALETKELLTASARLCEAARKAQSPGALAVGAFYIPSRRTCTDEHTNA